MRTGIGRWLTADRREVIIWGRPPVGLPYWHAVDIEGRRYRYRDDGSEVRGNSGPLLVLLSGSATLPYWWQHRAAQATSRICRQARVC